MCMFFRLILFFYLCQNTLVNLISNSVASLDATIDRSLLKQTIFIFQKAYGSLRFLAISSYKIHIEVLFMLAFFFFF